MCQVYQNAESLYICTWVFKKRKNDVAQKRKTQKCTKCMKTRNPYIFGLRFQILSLQKTSTKGRYALQCAVYSVRSTVCAVYSVRPTVCGLQCVRSTVRAVYSVCGLQCTFIARSASENF